MSTATLTPPPRTAVSVSKPPTAKLWTVEEFHRLGELGIFEGRRAMLIHGSILEEGPMNPPHAIAIELVADALRSIFGSGWRMRIQMPILLGREIDPEPDFAFVRGSARGTTIHPTTAALIVEVSDTSLKYDTTEKAVLYATAGIPEYWVLDLNARQLHVYRQPVDGVYTTAFAVPAEGTVVPSAVPDGSITIADLLP